MSGLIDLGCRVADVYRRYHEIHGAVFGAGSLRQIVGSLRSRHRPAEQEFAERLAGLRVELSKQETELVGLAGRQPVKASEPEVRQALLNYVRALDQAIAVLQCIIGNLAQDQATYRSAAGGERSAFSRDKLEYDRKLPQLERLGTRLNRLFSSY